MYRDVMNADGSVYGFAPTLGNIFNYTTLSVLIKDIYSATQAGYFWSQACATAGNRELGLYRAAGELGFYLGGSLTSLYSTTGDIIADFGSLTWEGDLQLDVNIPARTFNLLYNGVSIKSGSLTGTGTNRIDNILFFIGARANTDVPGGSAGFFKMASGDRIGELELRLDGVLTRHYIFEEGSAFATDLASSQTMSLGVSNRTERILVTPENNTLFQVLGVQ